MNGGENPGTKVLQCQYGILTRARKTKLLTQGLGVIFLDFWKLRSFELFFNIFWKLRSFELLIAVGY